jgi:phosphatidylserine/phosphatidylglycerophosphate/cardiolipin synthase-like enzyme
VLKALGAARDRGADVQVLYHAEDDEQKISNEEAIQNFQLGNICQPRNAQGLTLSHNKTIVLTKDGAAQAVLTGSTNFSMGGIYGHSNVVHVCERNEVAAKYLWLWNELKKNTPRTADTGVLVGKTPLPDDPLAKQITSIFSPRDTLKALTGSRSRPGARMMRYS